MRISCVWYIEEVDDFSNQISGGSSEVHGVHGRGWDGGIQFVNRTILKVKHQLFYHVVVGFLIFRLFRLSRMIFYTDIDWWFWNKLCSSFNNININPTPTDGKNQFYLFHYFLFILHANVHSEILSFFFLKKIPFHTVECW